MYYYTLKFNWGLGIGDWGLGIGDWAQSPIPIPNPQSPIPNPQSPIILNKFFIITNFIISIYIYNNTYEIIIKLIITQKIQKNKY